MAETIDVRIDAHVAHVSLARPDRGNALNLTMFEELAAAGRELAADKRVRAVVLAGEGKHFCTGMDTSVFADNDPATLTTRMQPKDDSPANFFQDICYVWRTLPVPVIAALQGSVFGGGLQLAMGADYRFADASVRCSVMEIRWGIIPDMALTTTMRHVIRHDHLRELVYTGRIVEAAEAETLGLVSRLCESPLEAAQALAAEIASRSPDAIRAAKSLMNSAFDLEPAASLRREVELQLGVLGRPNHLEAIRANVEKRTPEFRDPD